MAGERPVILPLKPDAPPADAHGPVVALAAVLLDLARQRRQDAEPATPAAAGDSNKPEFKEG
jgi:hypothetical protein